MVSLSGRSYLTVQEACGAWSFKPDEALSVDQARNWLGSGKTGGWVVSPSGETLVPVEEVNRVQEIVEVATGYGACYPGGWLPIVFQNGERLAGPL